MEKLKEREKKRDVRWKMANIIVRTAYERRCTIALEEQGKRFLLKA